MSRILRMNRRRIAELSGKKAPPSPLLEILLIIGFCAEINLTNVVEAWGQSDHSSLNTAPERNAKLARLRHALEEQVRYETNKPMADPQTLEKSLLTPALATMYEEMGKKTVELAVLFAQLIPWRVSIPTADLQKLMEHAIYMTDSAVAAFVYEEILWAKGAIEEGRAAAVLLARIDRKLASAHEQEEDSSAELHLVAHAVSTANGLIEEARQIAIRVVVFLGRSELAPARVNGAVRERRSKSRINPTPGPIKPKLK